MTEVLKLLKRLIKSRPEENSDSDSSNKPEETTPEKQNPTIIALNILSEMDIPEDLERKLFESFQVQKKFLLLEVKYHQAGSTFVSPEEMEFFSQLMSRLQTRPVIKIELSEEKKESLMSNLLEQINKHKDTEKPPVLFVKGFNAKTMEELDPDWNLDGTLRHNVQFNKWNVFFQGTGRFGKEFSISGSSLSTELWNEWAKQLS